jgi:cytochrome c oxidase cbb3-type subunit 4
MDTGTLRGIAVIFAMIAFLGICFWAYSRKRKKTFDDAANLPFDDEELDRNSIRQNHKARGNGDD